MKSVIPIPDSKTSSSAPQIDQFEALYRQYSGKVFQKCLYFTQDADTAKDYTHDIFLKVFAHLDRFEHRSSPATWLHTITHNYCLDQLKIARKYSFRDVEGEEDVQSDDTDFHEQLTRIEQLFEALPAINQQLLRMQYVQGLDQRSIAQQLNLSLSALKMRQQRSRLKLLKRYQQLLLEQ